MADVITVHMCKFCSSVRLALSQDVQFSDEVIRQLALAASDHPKALNVAWKRKDTLFFAKISGEIKKDPSTLKFDLGQYFLLEKEDENV